VQEIVFKNKSKRFSKNAINQKKISIFEKALEANPENERLLSGYMECCQTFME
jgi:hypothetical protein